MDRVTVEWLGCRFVLEGTVSDVEIRQDSVETSTMGGGTESTPTGRITMHLDMLVVREEFRDGQIMDRGLV